jgi:hypothetical protein
VIGNVPFCVGIPLSKPVEDKLKPGGRPVNWDHETAPVPPLDINCAAYGVPGIPPGRLVVVMLKGEHTTVIGNAALVMFAPESATWTVAVVVPALVGVPPTTPAEERVKPAGRTPDVTDQA